LQFEKAQPLLVQFVLTIGRRPYVSEPESVPAQLVASRDTVLVQHDNGHIPWTGVAREIAYAVKPLGEIGGLAGGIKEALTHTTAEEASRVLDELGYPPLGIRPAVEVIERPPVEGFGGERAPIGEMDRTQDVVEGSTGSTVVPGVSTGTSSTTTGDVTDDGAQRDGGTTAGRPGQPGVEGDDVQDSGSGGGQTGPTGPGGGPSQPPQKRRRQSRIFSYVYPDDLTSASGDGKGEERQAHRTRVEMAGIKYVLQYEIDHRREPEEMPHFNPGFDIRSIDGEGNARYIEVKALSGLWDGQNPAQMTHTEFEEARVKGDDYWLYVVELATSEEPQLHRIHNPVKWVQRYLLDHGWQPLAKIED
jgi:hypothetical protein